MKTSLLTLAISVFYCTLFAQNENPSAQFGYQAAIMPEQSRPKMVHQVDRLYIINQDSIDAVAIVALDAINRNITFYDKNRQVLKVDTLTNYTLARWISPDPYGQFSSPYLSMGNNPINGVDPDGGLFGLSQGWSALAGAGIGFGVGAGAAFLTGHDDDWLKWAAGGAVVGGAIGFATGVKRVGHGSHTKSATGGKIHDNSFNTKYSVLRQEKFKGFLSKEFYLDVGEKVFPGEEVVRKLASLKFNEKYTKTLQFSLKRASGATFGLERNGKDTFSSNIERVTPTYKNQGESFTPKITFTFPREEASGEATVNSFAPRIKVTRKVQGLFVSQIHGMNWNIER
jgi:hypothetical protein